MMKVSDCEWSERTSIMFNELLKSKLLLFQLHLFSSYNFVITGKIIFVAKYFKYYSYSRISHFGSIQNMNTHFCGYSKYEYVFMRHPGLHVAQGVTWTSWLKCFDTIPRSPSLGPISLISEAIDFCSWRASTSLTGDSTRGEDLAAEATAQCNGTAR